MSKQQRIETAKQVFRFLDSVPTQYVTLVEGTQPYETTTHTMVVDRDALEEIMLKTLAEALDD